VLAVAVGCGSRLVEGAADNTRASAGVSKFLHLLLFLTIKGCAKQGGCRLLLLLFFLCGGERCLIWDNMGAAAAVATAAATIWHQQH
jgi:hypothetical protein